MANAMAVASTAPDGTPAVRMVLLDAADEHGFAFQTNLHSPKARHFADRPRAALLFFWPKLLRQVRVTGSVSVIDPAEVRASFVLAPPEIQAMIRACRQGQPVADRAALEQLWHQALESAPHGGAEMPPDWGGFRVSLDTIEFWQGRDYRLQDRLRMSRSGNTWQVERLMP
jgi:pyridoxamine 5'-phosphate oxidase